jgi:polyhydroxyalkanoate synthesis regulator phasin
MDILKKTLQFGFGLAYIGKEHLDVLMKDLKKEYNLDEKQSKKLAKDIIKHTKDSHKKVKDLVEKHVKNFLNDSEIKKKKTTTKKKTSKKKPAKKRVVKKKTVKKKGRKRK